MREGETENKQSRFPIDNGMLTTLRTRRLKLSSTVIDKANLRQRASGCKRSTRFLSSRLNQFALTTPGRKLIFAVVEMMVDDIYFFYGHECGCSCAT